MSGIDQNKTSFIRYVKKISDCKSLKTVKPVIHSFLNEKEEMMILDTIWCTNEWKMQLL